MKAIRRVWSGCLPTCQRAILGSTPATQKNICYRRYSRRIRRRSII
nr:MAG TPA: hypothetical protein [Caudoviricetes sp.]